MQRSQDRATPMEQPHELPAGQLGDGRYRRQVCIHPFHQLLGQRGNRRPEPAYLPSTPQPAHRREWVHSAEEASRRLDLTRQAQIHRDMTGDRHNDVAV